MEEAQRSATPSREAETSKGERVLVVEDNRDVRALTVKRLERLGYQVIECNTGAEAKEALEKGLKVDVIFSDIMMPGGLTGIDLGRWVSQHRPALPVILTTGFADETAGNTVTPHDTWPILRKPYTQKDLATVMRTVLDRRSK